MIVLTVKTLIQQQECCCIVWIVSTIMLLCFIFGYLFVQPKRRSYFTKEFLSQFQKEHKDAFGTESQPNFGEGYPDMGNGRYSKKLGYKEWFLFNVGQRIHQNFYETLIFYCLTLAATSLKFPIIASILGVTYIILRILYSISYA